MYVSLTPLIRKRTLTMVSAVKKLPSDCRGKIRRCCLPLLLATAGTWLVLVVLQKPHFALHGLDSISFAKHGYRGFEASLQQGDLCATRHDSRKPVKSDSDTFFGNHSYTDEETAGGRQSHDKKTKPYMDSSRQLSNAWVRHVATH